MSSKIQAMFPQMERAVARLAEALAQPKTSFMRDSAIQRFEFTFELLWKTLKTYLEEKEGLECRTPRQTLQAAFQAGLMEDDPLWMDTIRLRNLTSHTYNENVAEEIYKALPLVLAAYQNLLGRLKKSL